MQSGILALHHGETLWLRPIEKGCFLNSPDMERFINTRSAEGHKRFVVDLGQCSGLDSTFMGMLMGAAKRLVKAAGCLQIVNAQGRNAQLLRGLGVHYFCPVSEDAACLECPSHQSYQPVECDELPHEKLTRQDHKAHCLKAHETLASACPENQNRFSEVVRIMKEECVPASVEAR